jgi:hypothetical protein
MSQSIYTQESRANQLEKIRRQREEKKKYANRLKNNALQSLKNLNNYVDSDGNNDITSFITNSKTDVLLISDTEGLNPKKQIDKIVEHYEKDGKIICLGDLFDYTFAGKIDTVKIDVDNLCQLKLLKIMVDGMKKGQCQCVIGNRDLNKIKLIPLLFFKNENDYWYENTENDTNILDIALRLLKTNQNNRKSNPASIWLMDDLRVVNPFWAANIKAVQNRNTKNKEINEYSKQSLKHRYDRIFGADPSVGSMSAQNTINYLPIELGYTDEVLKDKIKTLNDDSLLDELKAAIVFTVYARLLLKNKEHNSFFEYDGYLKYYLLNSTVSKYATINNNLYLFAHGGISNEFLDKQTKIYKNSKGKEKTENIIEDLKIVPWQTIRGDLTYNGNINENSELFMNGGGNIHEEMLKFNIKFEKIIEKLFTYKNLTYITHVKTVYFSNDMLVLLSLCAPAENNSKIPKQLYNTSQLSPIQARTPQFKYENKKYTKIYNIFGHAPAGMGFDFRKINDNNYSINTDLSNGLMKSTTLMDVSKYNENYLLLYISSQGDFYMEGELFIENNMDYINEPIEVIKNLNFDNETNNKIMQNIKDNLSRKLNIIYYKNSDVPIKFEDVANNNYNYHGNALVKEDDKLYVCKIISRTKPGPPFNKVLGIVKLKSDKGNNNEFGFNKVGLSRELISGGFHKTKKRNRKLKTKKHQKKSNKTKKH